MSTEARTVEELHAWLEELKAKPEPQAPWGLRWLDRLAEPENPWTHRFVLVCALLCYAGGFIWDPAAFFAAIGLWLIWQNSWQEYHRARSEKRRKAWRAQMKDMERVMRNYARLPQRMREIYGPGADCEGMGV